MIGNMLNDLAKAIRRWTEKNPAATRQEGGAGEAEEDRAEKAAPITLE